MRRRHRDDDDFRREIESHIALETDRLVAEGIDPAAARKAAIRKFGNVTRAQETFYESQRILWLEDLRRDSLYALKAFRRSPGFTAVAVLTLRWGCSSAGSSSFCSQQRTPISGLSGPWWRAGFSAMAR